MHLKLVGNNTEETTFGLGNQDPRDMEQQQASLQQQLVIGSQKLETDYSSAAYGNNRGCVVIALVKIDRQDTRNI
ncbi:MAG: hypothetical protein EZS28_024731 [Streblomastix strix]|uniref:Uncharacterized protein n=1 Tax=Streblomastix strix TaxID=222440 RepID=A0A5J4VBK3_9EUKA|nr:MAG: hypothetical protein EZS28_024731 [Streblomastix strix]